MYRRLINFWWSSDLFASWKKNQSRLLVVYEARSIEFWENCYVSHEDWEPYTYKILKNSPIRNARNLIWDLWDLVAKKTSRDKIYDTYEKRTRGIKTIASLLKLEYQTRKIGLYPTVSGVRLWLRLGRVSKINEFARETRIFIIDWPPFGGFGEILPRYIIILGNISKEFPKRRVYKWHIIPKRTNTCWESNNPVFVEFIRRKQRLLHGLWNR